MLEIFIEVDAPAGQAIGINEVLAMGLEQYGDTKVKSIKEVLPEQIKIEI